MKPDVPSKKVLITGINGFTGVYLESQLRGEGYEVFGTVIDAPKQPNHYRCDIVRKEQIDAVVSRVRPDYVIHTAAISFVGENNASLIYDVNVIGTENLLQSLLDNAVRPEKVIVAGSAAVYGNQGRAVLDETMCPKPVNHYGISKLAMEHVVSTYFNQLNLLIVRPFNYTGIGQADHFLVPKIVKHFRERAEVIELGNLDVKREFNDVRDVAKIYARLLRSEVRSQAVNLCSGRPVALRDIVESLGKLAGYDIEIKVNPAFVRKNEIPSLTGSTAGLEAVLKTDMPSFGELADVLAWMYRDDA